MLCASSASALAGICLNWLASAACVVLSSSREPWMHGFWSTLADGTKHTSKFMFCHTALLTYMTGTGHHTVNPLQGPVPSATSQTCHFQQVTRRVQVTCAPQHTTPHSMQPIAPCAQGQQKRPAAVQVTVPSYTASHRTCPFSPVRCLPRAAVMGPGAARTVPASDS